jgi:hypothetical protein
VRLDPADVEAIAQRVTELIDPRPPRAVRYVDAAQVAEVLGVERDWVYAHAHRLGALRLGGPNGRLRFDLQQVQRALAATPAPGPRRPALRPRRQRASATKAGLELLPYQS